MTTNPPQKQMEPDLWPALGRGKLVAGLFIYNIGFGLLLDSAITLQAYYIIAIGACLFLYGLVQYNFLGWQFMSKRAKRNGAQIGETMTKNSSSMGNAQRLLLLFLAFALSAPFSLARAQESAPTPQTAAETPPTKKSLSPTGQIREIDEVLKNYHNGKKLTEEQKKENAKIKNRVLTNDFNLTELCRLALGPHWAKLTAKKREEFVGIFTSLLLRNAILHSEKHTGKEKITYVSETPIKEFKGRILVKTKIEVPEEAVDFDVNYSMLYDAQKQRWRIYDLILDGESLLDNYQQQFDNIITKNSYEYLVKRMRSKLSEGKNDGSLN